MLDIQNIFKTFNPGTVNEKKALQGVSLHLDERRLRHRHRRQRRRQVHHAQRCGWSLAGGQRHNHH